MGFHPLRSCKRSLQKILRLSVSTLRRDRRSLRKRNRLTIIKSGPAKVMLHSIAFRYSYFRGFDMVIRPSVRPAEGRANHTNGIRKRQDSWAEVREPERQTTSGSERQDDKRPTRPHTAHPRTPGVGSGTRRSRSRSPEGASLQLQIQKSALLVCIFRDLSNDIGSTSTIYVLFALPRGS